MLSRLLVVISLAFLLIQFAFSQVEESHVDFTIKASVIQDQEIHAAYEWLTPDEFSQTELRLIDLTDVSSSHSGNNQIVASKISFISNRRFEELSLEKINSESFISKMLNSVATTKKSLNSWRVTTKVKAYGLPFKVSFDFVLKEIAAASMDTQVARYLRDEASVLVSEGRERFLILDMTNFSQLMYRNYSIVYMKELSSGETLVVAAIVAGVDLSKANSYFNYPPLSRTEPVMINNLRKQIIHMAREIQN